jgi:hypothetical protein
MLANAPEIQLKMLTIEKATVAIPIDTSTTAAQQASPSPEPLRAVLYLDPGPDRTRGL